MNRKISNDENIKNLKKRKIIRIFIIIFAILTIILSILTIALNISLLFPVLTYIITHLDPNIVIHRICADAPKNILVAPEWNAHKKWVLNGLDKILEECYNDYFR